MNWTRLRRMTFSLPLALLAALLLVAINETGYQRSRGAVADLGRSYATRNALNQLLQNMLNAETGLRGYLLTGDQAYLPPYEQAVRAINGHLDGLRQTYAGLPEQSAEFAALAQQVAHRLQALDQSLARQARPGSDAASPAPRGGDMGDLHAIRASAARLIAHSEQQAHASTQEIQQALMLSRLGIAGVAIIGLLAFYMYLRQTNALHQANAREQQALAHERDRLEQLVRERTQSLTQLANHLQQVREDERAHLARELHDELGALLTAAKLDLARLKSRIDLQHSDNAERVQHLTDTLNSGIALKRRIIENLRPSSLSNLGLTAALENLTRDFAAHGGVQMDTSFDEVPLSEAAQLTVYRLVQESLTNIGKYANARQVLVCVHDRADHVLVQVRDDGQGFDSTRIAPDAHGLLGMRHRVEAAGGQFEIRSTPGVGTLVSATLPRESAAAPDAS
ncbi:MAG: CHASE3 domain-containing protein [Proteobacteria bacterium]|nr:CHASE3 domain-containing protein [Pseudomonadota bacterium]